MASYIALLRKDPGSDYGVEFPDFPGCITAGRTADEARRMAAEALALHVQGMMEDATPVPEPSPLDAVMAEPANRDAIGFLVDVASGGERSLRVNVTLPADVLNAIDRVSRNRSRFLAEAAREKLRGR